MLPPIQRVLFYRLPRPPHHHSNNISDNFRKSIIPQLTASLSVALRYFYPLAGRLIVPARPENPYIRYSPAEGDSDDNYNFVPFTVAETTALDFDQLTSYDRPNNVRLLCLLLPNLPPIPLLAFKVTLFPDYASLCIGLQYSHVAADNLAFSRFLKSWASICRGDSVNWAPPCHDRALANVDRNLEQILLEHLWNSAGQSFPPPPPPVLGAKVRATFIRL